MSLGDSVAFEADMRQVVSLKPDVPSVFLSRQQTFFTNPQMALDGFSRVQMGLGVVRTRLIGENLNPTLSTSNFSDSFAAPSHLSSSPRSSTYGDKSPYLSWLRAHRFLENNKEDWVDASSLVRIFSNGCLFSYDFR